MARHGRRVLTFEIPRCGVQRVLCSNLQSVLHSGIRLRAHSISAKGVLPPLVYCTFYEVCRRWLW